MKMLSKALAAVTLAMTLVTFHVPYATAADTQCVKPEILISRATTPPNPLDYLVARGGEAQAVAASIKKIFPKSDPLPADAYFVLFIRRDEPKLGGVLFYVSKGCAGGYMALTPYELNQLWHNMPQAL